MYTSSFPVCVLFHPPFLTDMSIFRSKLPVISGPVERESEMEAVGKTTETDSSSTDDDSLSVLTQSMSSQSLKRKLPDEREMKSARQNSPPLLQSHQPSVSTDDSRSVSG